MKEINFAEIEKKWQDKWEKKKVFEVSEKSKKAKKYILEMFPYPSAEGLHMGHALNYTIGDIQARYFRMKGFNVLYPMGFDALGLPAENAAIKAGSHPNEFTKKAIENYVRQMNEIGLSYDWSKMVNTSNPEYYKWDQWIFLKMLEKGLAYRKKAPVNFCSKCDSVLANEQVHQGKCWRHEDIDVEIRHLEQWFLKTTDYADELLDMVDSLEWPERIKIMQKNWIGKSYGTEIDFEINGEKWPIFTTRADTIYGVTFMVVSAQHLRLHELVTDSQKGAVEEFLKKVKSVSEKDAVDLEKEGVFTGSYAVNPLTNEKVPVYAGNFVVAEYGSGMVMAVPAHDQRDFEFAKKYGIEIKVVIDPVDHGLNAEKMARAFTARGRLTNSEKFDGWDNVEAVDEITKFLEEKRKGKKSVQFKLRDWLISRQRYWGTPIPVIYCDSCGAVPVAEKDLPVELPKDVEFGKGNPLESNEKFVNVECPQCGSPAKRETDTMDTFVNSSWYYLRYFDNENSDELADRKKIDYWMPVDQYIGGAEHATMHLIYARFYTKFLRDIGLLKFDEPFTKLFNQGMLHGEDGEKMSKSRGNVVLPEVVSKKYGIDTARLFLVSIASPDKNIEWSDKGIEGSLRFIKKIFEGFESLKIEKSSKRLESKLNKVIKEISEDIGNFRYNLAVIKIRGLFSVIDEEGEISGNDLMKFVKLLSVFCPHVAEELWEKLGGKGFVSLNKWPESDESKIDENLERVEKIVEKTVDDVNHVINLIRERDDREVGKVYVYVVPNELEFFDAGVLSARLGKDVLVFANNDKKAYDPESKGRKAKPGKPGIYLE
ncbi:leucine--tRNA ligase [Candidatus Pacearchaeota archaeon]|nr:leucine--tRNA ligase [Candidatus Pacearchaeota archaeon]